MEKPNFFRVLSVVAATVLAVAVLALVISSVFATKTYAAETKVIPSTADTKIAENASDTNYGSDTSIGADGDDPNGTGKDKSALIKWDLSAIAPGTQVNSASITLNVTNSSTNTYQAYKLKQPWSESTATWNVSSSGSPWQVAGAQGALDRDTTVAGTISPLVTGNQTLSITPTVVQGWVDDPTSNQGIIIANTTNTDGLDFYSRESTTASQRPTLTLGLGTDTTPPETTIDSGPSGTFSNTSASFTFSSSELNSTFECRLDGAAFSSCTSPKSYDSLSDGSHTFEVRATDAAGNTDATPASRTWTVDSTSAQNDPVLVGAGDIASCASSGDEATAKLLDSISGSVFTIGDNAYESGTDAEFKNCYDPSWGRHKARTKPSVGNHEYVTAGASGYFNYFGTAAGDPTKGYYSYDSGQWHIVALNAMCENVGGCDSSSPQITWLKSDLAAHPTTCTLAYWHHPVFSSGSGHGNDPKMQPAWDALYAAGADVVLNGHDHDYERFAPQTPSAAADLANGIREFVVGTGGASHNGLGTKRANSEVFNGDTYGVLKLTLHSSSYDWQFVPEAGKSFADSGSGQCHGAPGDMDTTPPTVSSVVPTGGATDVAPNTNVTASFSEDMDSSTLSSSTFTLAPVDSSGNVGQPITAMVTYDSATKKATLDPSADLNPGTKYTATVTTGAKDKAGNPLVSAKVWSFTTAQIAAPSGLQATRSGNPNRQSINLTWTDNSSNEDNFTVERCTGSSSYCAINGNWQVLTSTLAANTTSYAENSVSRGTTYWYRVKATKGTLSSGYSNVASAITK